MTADLQSVPNAPDSAPSAHGDRFSFDPPHCFDTRFECDSENDDLRDEVRPILERLEACEDRGFVARFRDVPSYINLWTREHGGMADRRVLDFGCGRGISACGASLLYGASSVYGVDINREYDDCALQLALHAGVETFPRNVTFAEIEPGEPLNEVGFDLAFSWSVFEHVHLDLFDEVIRDLWRVLAS